MRKRDVAMGACFCLALVWGGGLLVISGGKVSTPEVAPRAERAMPGVESVDQVLEDAEWGAAQAKRGHGGEATVAKGGAGQNEHAEPALTVQYPEGLEGIKQQIYDMNIEYIEDLDALDAAGQVTDQPPEVLWQGDWSSADDWKRRGDGFRIEQRDDGTYALFPDADTSRSYAWDDEKGEFAWEQDYYGKIITHKARFIDDDVLVLMKISGRKVALDIYRKGE
ncbi:hypothetical protein DSLASN_24210 [Desulfoluna limicola]|uniref:Lipoprotein n=1 Tax=Desulfoluna limicola TaxID=2810562 RepID=A0ABM7PHW2_9BACT|nr:hypothetical protein [Desulfoluna limicola]BCS96789.1 hypothetical protein DSLASN_24210 [Desulfoluna limicola]